MTNIRQSRRPIVAFAALSLLATSACSEDAAQNDEQTSAEPNDDTLAEALADADDMSAVASALGDSGLVQVFDGAGSYTIFAPNDAAFDKLGEAGNALRKPGQSAAMAAILRDHIVPGYLTPDDIEAALESQGGTVKVETMGDHTLTFTRSGGGIMITSEDGSKAMLTGTTLKASNGVAIALDGVLKKLDAQPA